LTNDDLNYLRGLLSQKVINGPILNLGAGDEGQAEQSTVSQFGHRYVTTDIFGAVDFIANFETGDGLDKILASGLKFGTVWVCNVLEHTFEPTRVLDNVMKILEPGAKIVVITPIVWPIHNYPIDVYRLLPDFYTRYAETRGLGFPKEHFLYLGYGPVENYRLGDGTYQLPKHRSMLGMRGWFSRIVHRVLNTSGRGILFKPNIAIGAVFVVP
jgi:SAM-dependent methyltransferase